jgi:hypothetical protein
MVAYMNMEAEILDLKRRVGDLEGALSVLTGQLRTVHPELLAFKQDAGDRFERVTSVLTGLEHRLGGLEIQLWSLRDDLPDIVRIAVREGIAGPSHHAPEADG